MIRQRPPAATSLPIPILPKSKPTKPSPWKTNPLVIYGIPSLILLIITLYLTLTPSSPPSSPSSSSRTPPLIRFTSTDDPHCHPLTILDDSDAHMRILRCGQCVLGGEYLSANISIFASNYVQSSVALASTLTTPPSPPTFLILGLGAGHVASIFQSTFNMIGDIVEQSESIARSASAYFAFQPSRRVFIQSAQSFITSLAYHADSDTCQKKGEYDVISIDLFDSSNTLPSLSVYTQSSLRALACTLTPRGILSISLLYLRTPAHHLRSPHSLYLTLTSLFPHVIAYHDGGTDPIGNLMLMASRQPFTLDLSTLTLPSDWTEEVEEGEGGEGRLALQYAVGSWRSQLKGRRIDWSKQKTVTKEGRSLYSPMILTNSTLPVFQQWQTEVIAEYHKSAHRLFDFL